MKWFFTALGSAHRHKKLGNKGYNIYWNYYPTLFIRHPLAGGSIQNTQLSTGTTATIPCDEAVGNVVSTNRIQHGNGRHSAKHTQYLLSWKHCIFEYRTPRRLRKISRMWLLLSGTAMWLLWLERNDAVFNGILWPTQKMHNRVWLSMIDYGKSTTVGHEHKQNAKGIQKLEANR